MNYAKIDYKDCGNGPGFRQTIFFSGCTFNCDGCFNKEAQDFNFGKEFTKEIQDEFILKAKRDYVMGINILGGEPLQQDLNILSSFLKRLKEETGKSIWLWTGYNDNIVFANNSMLEVLAHLEVIVTGQFQRDKRSSKLMYKGSSNQKVIDVKKTLEAKELIIWEE